MATRHGRTERGAVAIERKHETRMRTGSGLMAIAGAAFVAYGLVFLALVFVGEGFELGVATLDGLTKAELTAQNPAVSDYISHLHAAVAAFIISTGIAVAALAWYGVRDGLRWAWAAAVASAVLGLAIALPMHYTGRFTYDSLAHLGPIYLAAAVFVVGAALAYRGMRRPEPSR